MRRQAPHRKAELHNVVFNVIDTGISLRPLEKPDKLIDRLSFGGEILSFCNTSASLELLVTYVMNSK